MRHQYILDKNWKPVPEPDLLKWGHWMGTANRHVGKIKIGNSLISTVFLGINYNFDVEGSPILWETMVFGGPLDQEMDRCAGNREQAEAMHNAMITRVKNA